jgi:hypothetical protein
VRFPNILASFLLISSSTSFHACLLIDPGVM